MAGVADVEVVKAAALERAQRRVAGSVLARGLQQGDRIALVLPGSGAYLAAVLGMLRRGVVPVVLDPRLTAYELTPLLDDADPAIVIDDPAGLAGLLEGPEAELAPWPLARPMHFTSGTTGSPKGVWSGIRPEREAAALVQEERELWEFAAEDRHVALSPLHHSAPLRFAMGTLLAGGTVLLPGPFEAATFAQAVARYAPTTTFAVPAHMQRLLAHADSIGELPSMRSFRLFAHAGAPCPAPVKEQMINVLPGGTLWEFYGSTEGQFTACRAEEWLERRGTVGRARPGRTLAVDPDGTIWCTVPAHATFTYWRDPEKTAAAWRETAQGPAFTVGDHGRLDEDGYLYLSGRRDDLVISGGVNVYPAEVENVLNACPGVFDAAVFGVADERWGQRVCAAVVGTASRTALEAWARERLAPAKRPKDYYIVRELPRTSSGKVRRLDLPGLVGLT